MDHLDKLIPLAILAGVALLLVLLLFRAARLEMRETAAPTDAPPVAPTVAPPVVEKPAEPIAPPVEKPTKRIRMKRKPASEPVQATPIAKVLDMLTDKDALATAFLLREILDRPVSQRGAL